MSDIDLTEAVAEADEWLAEHRVTDSWRVIRRLRDTLVRASDDIERAVREQVAREIERAAAAYRTEADRRVRASDREYLDGCAMAADGCALIARGGTA